MILPLSGSRRLTRPFLPSDPDLTFSSLIQRHLESTHLLLAQAHSSTCRSYRSSLGIEYGTPASGAHILEIESLDSFLYRLVTSSPYPYANLTLTLSSSRPFLLVAQIPQTYRNGKHARMLSLAPSSSPTEPAYLPAIEVSLRPPQYPSIVLAFHH